eukprot:366228-Chlamydomonas_euryale.AAC.28
MPASAAATRAVRAKYRSRQPRWQWYADAVASWLSPRCAHTWLAAAAAPVAALAPYGQGAPTTPLRRAPPRSAAAAAARPGHALRRGRPRPPAFAPPAGPARMRLHRARAPGGTCRAAFAQPGRTTLSRQLRLGPCGRRSPRAHHAPPPAAPGVRPHAPRPQRTPAWPCAAALPAPPRAWRTRRGSRAWPAAARAERPPAPPRPRARAAPPAARCASCATRRAARAARRAAPGAPHGHLRCRRRPPPAPRDVPAARAAGRAQSAVQPRTRRALPPPMCVPCPRVQAQPPAAVAPPSGPHTACAAHLPALARGLPVPRTPHTALSPVRRCVHANLLHLQLRARQPFVSSWPAAAAPLRLTAYFAAFQSCAVVTRKRPYASHLLLLAALAAPRFSAAVTRMPLAVGPPRQLASLAAL